MRTWQVILKLIFVSCLAFGCGSSITSPDEPIQDGNDSTGKEKNGRSVLASPLQLDRQSSGAIICDRDDYDLDCQEESGSLVDGFLGLGNAIKKEALESETALITDRQQDDYGENTRAEIFKEMPQVRDHPDSDLVNGLMKKLLSSRKDPSKIDYNIYIVRSEMVNAFTIGGEIFITTRLLEEIDSIDELACIIGHEIGHNELRHIAQQIAEEKISRDLFGDEAGSLVIGYGRMLTMGFNQKNELESDIFGIDLALAAGFNSCRGLDFWNRMSRNEVRSEEWEDFFRSHPYSDQRIICYSRHLKEEHQIPCNQP